MDIDPEDQEIIRLLRKIKEAEREYPERMLVARRHSYLKRMGEIGMGIGADMGIKDVVKDAKPSSISPATSTLLETALVIAIIAEASTVAYFYRHQLADFFKRVVAEPRVQEVTPPPVSATSYGIQGIAPSPALTVTVPGTAIPSATMWSAPSPTGVAVTPTGTPGPDVIPGVADNNSISTATTGTGEAILLNSTPGPNDNSGSNENGNNGNNGHHYGQTPKPERTKENGNNPPPKDNEDKPPRDDNDKPPKDNEDEPPKEDKPPKDNDNKPPKNK